MNDNNNCNLYITILAAGKGTRMGSSLPKVLHKVNGIPMIHHVLEVSEQLRPKMILPVVGHKRELVTQYIDEHFDVQYVEQIEQLGTGHAIQQLKSQLFNKLGNLLILSGDVPGIKLDTLELVLQAHINNGSDLTVVSCVVDEPHGYGRILRDLNNKPYRILEEKDCDPACRIISEINTGVYVVKMQHLFDKLDSLSNNNNSGEYYLTDLVELYSVSGLKTDMFIADNFEQFAGINTIEQLNRFNK